MSYNSTSNDCISCHKLQPIVSDTYMTIIPGSNFAQWCLACDDGCDISRFIIGDTLDEVLAEYSRTYEISDEIEDVILNNGTYEGVYLYHGDLIVTGKQHASIEEFENWFWLEMIGIETQMTEDQVKDFLKKNYGKDVTTDNDIGKIITSGAPINGPHAGTNKDLSKRMSLRFTIP